MDSTAPGILIVFFFFFFVFLCISLSWVFSLFFCSYQVIYLRFTWGLNGWSLLDETEKGITCGEICDR